MVVRHSPRGREASVDTPPLPDRCIAYNFTKVKYEAIHLSGKDLDAVHRDADLGAALCD
jgi:hypothetical protein